MEENRSGEVLSVSESASTDKAEPAFALHDCDCGEFVSYSDRCGSTKRFSRTDQRNADFRRLFADLLNMDTRALVRSGPVCSA